MSWTNVYLTQIAEQASNIFGQGWRSTAGLLKVVGKEVLPPGVYDKNVILPGAVTATTRSAGGQWTTQQPTDTYATLTPNTEYGNHISIDRINEVGSVYDLAQFYLPSMVGAIIDELNDACWDLYSSFTTNAANTPGGTPDYTVLAQAKKKLMDQEVFAGQQFAVIGTSEEAAWSEAIDWSSGGPDSQQTIVNGELGTKYGFKVVVDQRRKEVGTATFNLALHPAAMTVCFRSSMPPAPAGVTRTQFTDPLSGVTLFVEERPMDIATYGIGRTIQVYCMASVTCMYEEFGCIIHGVTGE